MPSSSLEKKIVIAQDPADLGLVIPTQLAGSPAGFGGGANL